MGVAYPLSLSKPLSTYIHTIKSFARYIHTCLHTYVHWPNLFLQTHLKKVAEQFPDDVEAWIELAGILEQGDVQVNA